jgi:adenine-specific DNA methylase
MAAFPTKADPSSAKLRGGYYTPPAIADFVAAWVGQCEGRVLEPSCGDGVFLAPLLERSREVVAVELDPDEGAKAKASAPAAEVILRDFFDWFGPQQHEAWDGAAGNPPFIRFQHWTEPTRSLAFDVMRQVGMRPTKLTNAWVPFVVASALSLSKSGRLGLVVPAELMQVTYAAELRAFLVDEFEELTVVTFKRLVFDGILQEVVLLLGIRGVGPARIKVVEVEDVTSLPNADALTSLPHAPALRHEREKWTKYFLDPAEIGALRNVREKNLLPRLGELADVDVGIVTGRNQFFVMRPSTATQRGIEEHLLPLVSKSAHLRGVRFGALDLSTLEEEDALCRLLAVEESIALDDEEALRAYVLEGEAEDIHKGYKCSIRKQWWVVPSIWTPDAFLLRQIHNHPRIIANLAGATSTDTIHRVRMLNSTSPTALAAASVNSATFAFSEVMGRSYGGGVLELEPREAEALPIPDPRSLTDEDVQTVDALTRSGRLEAALDHVDHVLLSKAHGISDALINDLRCAWERLRDRRLARGRKAR